MFRVLVVDDLEVNRRLVRVILDSWREGLDIEEAENGMEALVNLECRHYDLMVCDVRMPILDGISLLEKIRGQDSTREMPIIMLTAVDLPEKIVGAYDLGATSYLTKPFNRGDLIEALDAHVPSQVPA